MSSLTRRRTVGCLTGVLVLALVEGALPAILALLVPESIAGGRPLDLLTQFGLLCLYALSALAIWYELLAPHALVQRTLNILVATGMPAVFLPIVTLAQLPDPPTAVITNLLALALAVLALECVMGWWSLMVWPSQLNAGAAWPESLTGRQLLAPPPARWPGAGQVAAASVALALSVAAFILLRAFPPDDARTAPAAILAGVAFTGSGAPVLWLCGRASARASRERAEARRIETERRAEMRRRAAQLARTIPRTPRARGRGWRLAGVTLAVAALLVAVSLATLALVDTRYLPAHTLNALSVAGFTGVLGVIAVGAYAAPTRVAVPWSARWLALAAGVCYEASATILFLPSLDTATTRFTAVALVALTAIGSGCCLAAMRIPDTGHAQSGAPTISHVRPQSVRLRTAIRRRLDVLVPIAAPIAMPPVAVWVFLTQGPPGGRHGFSANFLGVVLVGMVLCVVNALQRRRA